MKVNKLLVVAGLIALYTHTHTHTQLLAQEPKWGIHNSIVDYSNLTSSPLPTTPNPDYTQNAVWDNSGNLVLYEADGIIYNKNGVVILDQNTEIVSLYSLSNSTQTGFTEFIFVPVPDSCGQYYGISTYSNGSYWYGYITDVIWCKIDLNLNNGLGGAKVLPQTNLKVANIGINCITRERETESSNHPVFNMHIEVTKKLANGNRYLFAANSTCVAVLDVDGSGISYINSIQVDGYQRWASFRANLRSEMEVFQNDSKYEVAMSFYDDGSMNGLGHATIFEFEMSTPVPQISHYHVTFSQQLTPQTFIKGLEYSGNGLTLYATVMTVSTMETIIAGDNIIYFDRPTLSDPFQYGGVITYGQETMDFGLGMIEKGRDGKLYIAGEGRLATIDDNNVPTSTFTPTALTISNQLTTAPAYNDGIPNSTLSTSENIRNRKMYLLVDQIDGEDYSMWATVPDLYPASINVTCFPYSFPYSIPPNANINYSGQMSWNFPDLELQSYGTPLTIQFVNEYGCAHTENITILYHEELWCDATFTHQYTKAHSTDVPVSADCDNPLSTIHEFYLYLSDGQGGWVLIDSCYTASCTLSGLQINQNYKIVHNVYNTGSSCHPFDTTYHLLSTF